MIWTRSVLSLPAAAIVPLVAFVGLGAVDGAPVPLPVSSVSPTSGHEHAPGVARRAFTFRYTAPLLGQGTSQGTAAIGPVRVLVRGTHRDLRCEDGPSYTKITVALAGRPDAEHVAGFACGRTREVTFAYTWTRASSAVRIEVCGHRPHVCAGPTALLRPG